MLANPEKGTHQEAKSNYFSQEAVRWPRASCRPGKYYIVQENKHNSVLGRMGSKGGKTSWKNTSGSLFTGVRDSPRERRAIPAFWSLL